MISIKHIQQTHFLIGFIAVLSLSSCTKESTPNINLNEKADTAAILRLSGIFQNGPYGNIRGNASIYLKDSIYTLLLDSFSVNNGPDLKVYLSKEIQPINYINLGSLKSVTGSQIYTISGTNGAPSFSEYKYALIHCQQYNHLFGYAELK